MENIRVLIVEDEPRIARFVQMELEHEGFITATEGNGKRALERIIQEEYDIVLLDVMLPEIDGIEICQRVREILDIPIIMLTAKDAIEDKVKGLDIGANDYITKPFAVPELLARMRNALRSRTLGEPARSEGDTEKLTLKNLTMYPARFEVEVAGTPVQLTKKEYDLLEYLIRNKRTVLSRDQILQEVWGYDYSGETNVVDVYIRYLRAKLDDEFKEKYIHTIRGVGYVVRD